MKSRAIPRPVSAALWTLLAIYGVARVLQLFALPTLLLVVLHVLPPLLFMLLHGSMAYRLRGILLFAALSYAVSNFFENLSILTGFPFGHYHFTSVMGPKLFLVPVTLGLAYLGIGYLAFVLGRLLVCGAEGTISGRRVLLVPLTAAFAMVAWDVSAEPVWSTVLRCWIWHDAGTYFGVPLSNFLGWYLTTYTFYQLFAWHVSRRQTYSTPPRTYWQMAVLFYGLCAVGNMLIAFTPHAAEVVTDATGVEWHVAAITRACALASFAAMGPFVLLARRKLHFTPAVAPPSDRCAWPGAPESSTPAQP